MEALILPRVEAVNTPDNFEGLEIVSFFERLKTLNLASPKIFHASGE
jgi:hypothetical protein